MLREKIKKFYKTLNLVIILELLLSPISFAQSTDVSTSKKENWWNKSAEYIGNFSTFLNATVQGHNNANQGNINQYKTSLSPALKVTPVDPNQLPGVFQGCVVLPARPNALSDSMKCTQTDQNEIRNGYAAALIEIAEENRNDLRNFQTRAHEPKTAQGLSCYDEAIKNANAQLLAREEQVNLYQQNLKDLLEKFNLTANPLLETVKSNGALLDGGANFDKYHKDGKFSDLFLGANDPNNSCGSMLTATSLQKLGKDGGVRGIQDHMFKQLTEKPKSPTAVSAQKLLQTSSQIESEIDNLANKLTSNMTNSNSSKPDINAISYNGRIMSKKNPAMAKVLENFNAEFDQKKKSILSQYNIADITSGNSTVQSLLGKATKDNNPSDYNSLVQSLDEYELMEKDRCLKGDYLKGLGGVSGFASKFRDRNSRIKGKDNALATLIAKVINSGKPIDQMIKEIAKAESKEKYKNYVYSSNKSIVLDDKVIKASTAMRASGYLEIFKDQCETMWSAKDPKNGNGYSKAQAVNEVKKVAMEMTNHRKVAASTLNSQIKQELKTCSGDTSTGVSSNSCESALDMNSANFCLRTAKQCATNTQACYSKLNKAFTDIKTEQYNAKNRYNFEVTKLKKSLKNELRGLNNELIRQSRIIDAQLDLGGVFTAPETTFDESKKIYLSAKDKEIDESLRMEDPEAYINALIEDSKLMGKSMAAQREKYFGKNGKRGEVNQIAKGYIKSYKSNEKVWTDIINDCNQAIAGINKSDAEQQKAQQEKNENLNKYCGSLQAFNQDPESVDHEQLAQDLGTVIQIAAANPMENTTLASDKAAIAKIRAWDSKCEVEEDGLFVPNSDKSSKTHTASSFCGDSTAVGLFGEDAETACKQYKETSNSKVKPCDKKRLANYKKNIVNAKEPFCYHNKKIQKCDSNKSGNLITEINIDSYNDDLESALSCTIIPEGFEDVKKVIARYAASYNCHEQRKKAGAISVRVCNSVSESGVGKDMYADMFRELGGAYGTSLGLSN